MFKKPSLKPNYYDQFFKNKLMKTEEIIKKQEGTGVKMRETKIQVKEPKKPLPGTKLVAEFKKLNCKS